MMGFLLSHACPLEHPPTYALFFHVGVLAPPPRPEFKDTGTQRNYPSKASEPPVPMDTASPGQENKASVGAFENNSV